MNSAWKEGRRTPGLAVSLRRCIDAARSPAARCEGEERWCHCFGAAAEEWKAAADGIVFVAAAEWQTLPTKIHPRPLCSLLGSGVSPCQHSAMNPGCMLLFVFGFVGGAVVINSAILVSLSVLLLVHFSISTGVPALTQNLPRILRYSDPLNLSFSCSFCLLSLFLSNKKSKDKLKMRIVHKFKFFYKLNVYGLGHGNIFKHSNVGAFCLSKLQGLLMYFCSFKKAIVLVDGNLQKKSCGDSFMDQAHICCIFRYLADCV